MKSHNVLLSIVLTCGMILGGVAAVGAQGPVAHDKYKDIHLNPSGISSATECGKCHQDIYATWTNSLHARATDNPVFWTALLEVFYKKGESARKTCFACHSPIASWNLDYELKNSLTREGINCDFCHTISEALPPGNSGPRYRHEWGLVKQGPLKNAVSPVHATRFNALFSHSRICGGCHQYENPDGVRLIETFSEWQASPYPARNIHCQNCHMRKVAGKIVSEKILKTPGREISTHDIAVGHSLSLREKSFKLEIKEIRVHRRKVEVTVDLTNQGAGHKIPTGLPSKKIILQVSLKSGGGGYTQIQTKVYQKKLVDRNGNPVLTDADLMMEEGLRIASDNRIAPLETRRERFTFFVPKEGPHRVAVAIYYSHQPRTIRPAPIRIKIKEVTQLVER